MIESNQHSINNEFSALKNRVLNQNNNFRAQYLQYSDMNHQQESQTNLNNKKFKVHSQERKAVKSRLLTKDNTNKNIQPFPGSNV